MGADLLIYALTIEHGKSPDFEAATRWIDELSNRKPADWPAVETYSWDVELDPEEDPLGWVAENVARLRSDLNEFRDAMTHGSRELAVILIRNADVYLTGGMSWGETPTELADVFTRLDDSGVAVAAGFDDGQSNAVRIG